MNNIQYVCLSDLHLGADNSLLTHINPTALRVEPLEISPVLRQLMTCLRELLGKNTNGEKPTLVLNGDLLEMALSNTNQAAMVFEGFLKLAFPPDGEHLFKKEVMFLPGNHDHHLWESARETLYVSYLEEIPAGNPLPVAWHTTNMIRYSPVDCYLLNRLARRFAHLKDLRFMVAYPNWAVVSENKQKAVIFSHGHYIESIYALMSKLKTMLFPDRKKPENIWDLEAENFAWIDFFWSTLGRSGEVGKGVEVIYNKMQDTKQFEKIIYNLSKSVADMIDLPLVPEAFEANILFKVLSGAIIKTAQSERGLASGVLSDDAKNGLEWYLSSPLYNQIRVEMGGIDTPRDLTFVFGHTHKPFVDTKKITNYAAPIKMYNSGGWVVDTLKPEAIVGGAVVFVSDDLEAASIRFYNETGEPIIVQQANYADAKPSAFAEHLQKNSIGEAWDTFGTVVKQEIAVRQRVLKASING